MKKEFLFIAVLLSGLALQAQQEANVSGGEASGSGGSASYSVGQVAYKTHTGTSGSVAEGVLHSYEISVVSAIEGVEEIKFSVSAYPNPTTDYLSLIVEEIGNSDLHFELYDINGKLLQRENIVSNLMAISLEGLISATYFVKVIHKHKIIKTFKVIKSE